MHRSLKKRIISFIITLMMVLPLAATLPVSADVYSLYVAGVQVTNENADDILGNGIFSYNAEENRLTVNGSYKSKEYVISNSVPNLTVYVLSEPIQVFTCSRSSVLCFLKTFGDI